MCVFLRPVTSLRVSVSNSIHLPEYFIIFFLIAGYIFIIHSLIVLLFLKVIYCGRMHVFLHIILNGINSMLVSSFIWLHSHLHIHYTYPQTETSHSPLFPPKQTQSCQGISLFCVCCISKIIQCLSLCMAFFTNMFGGSPMLWHVSGSHSSLKLNGCVRVCLCMCTCVYVHVCAHTYIIFSSMYFLWAFGLFPTLS